MGYLQKSKGEYFGSKQLDAGTDLNREEVLRVLPFWATAAASVAMARSLFLRSSCPSSIAHCVENTKSFD
jgi:hypothetical protein